jgi:hypothetical protein
MRPRRPIYQTLISTAIVLHEKTTNVQADSRGGDGGHSRHKDHEESCLVLDKSRTIVKEGFCLLLTALAVAKLSLLSQKIKIEMMLFKLFTVALFLCFWVSSIQATDHHPLQILLDDLGKQPTFCCLCFDSPGKFSARRRCKLFKHGDHCHPAKSLSSKWSSSAPHLGSNRLSLRR